MSKQYKVLTNHVQSQSPSPVQCRVPAGLETSEVPSKLDGFASLL